MLRIDMAVHGARRAIFVVYGARPTPMHDARTQNILMHDARKLKKAVHVCTDLGMPPLLKNNKKTKTTTSTTATTITTKTIRAHTHVHIHTKTQRLTNMTHAYSHFHTCSLK